jgi:hypothetical protein
MTDQDKEYLRDLTAMFAMNGLITAYKDNHPDNVLAERAFALADAMIEAREPKSTIGLPAIKRKRTK